MIIVTELGDKTFFIAAVLAMRDDRLLIFGGAIGEPVGSNSHPVCVWSMLWCGGIDTRKRPRPPTFKAIIIQLQNPPPPRTQGRSSS